VLRWNELVVNLRRLLEQGAFGELFMCETDYWHGIGEVIRADRWIAKRDLAGSAFLTGGCHAVDMARFLCGEITRVSAYSRHGIEGFEYDTTAVASVKFESGAVGRISSCLEIVAPYHFNIKLMGSEGTALGNRIWSRRLTPEQSDYFELVCELPDSGDVEHHPFQEEIDHLADCILEGRDCDPNIADGIRTSRVCLAVDRSAAAGGEPQEPRY
jgi:UDP-N-acetyl-2-amino-2-deoxyglucuronate dehydrogenase